MIFTEYPNDFCHKRKMDNFDPYNVLLAIATNIPVLLMTAFVLQGHILESLLVSCMFSLLICPLIPSDFPQQGPKEAEAVCFSQRPTPAQKTTGAQGIL